MRKKLVICLAILLLVFVVGFLLSSILMRQGIYPNNNNLTDAENQKIKAVLLDAVKDRCSSLYKLDKSKIYDADSAADIIQYEAQSNAPKRPFCLIDPNFMRTTIKTDNRYQVTLKVFYPESCYYCFEIEVIDGEYLITYFQIDV